MTNLNNQRFTRKQADRILADAAERESCDYGTEAGEGLTYTQIVQIAQEAGIDSKYLKRSAKDLVKEVGGLERAAGGNAFKKVRDVFYNIASLYYTLPSSVRKSDDKEFVGWMGTAINGCILTIEAGLGFKYDSDIGLIVFGTHVATNLASGIYELYRHEKNKLVDEMNSEEKNEQPRPKGRGIK